MQSSATEFLKPRLVNGETVGSVDVPYVLVTPDNMDQYLSKN